jgi:serine/threonine protein kinase/tetratricopeptide (TPR) repeat protein
MSPTASPNDQPRTPSALPRRDDPPACKADVDPEATTCRADVTNGVTPADADGEELLPVIESVLHDHATTRSVLKELHRRFNGDLVGTEIGPYKILEELGRGRFGEVYRAQQRGLIDREVALKAIRLGMDTEEVIARFEVERQALAMMEHASIAQVLDAGTTESGRPYIVMELVKGIPITDYCEKHRLALRERLELFVEVCRAVQHAHQKCVIHRDLKPSNVLVTIRDGKPTPKLVDFGLAKATGAKLTDGTAFTCFGHFVGTPDYMSPEQANPTSLDIDAKTDVYALGVLLYELLTETTPFDLNGLGADLAGQAEIQRIIATAEPTKPSSRLESLRADARRSRRERDDDGGDGGKDPIEACTLEQVAARRRTNPPALIRAIRGDLDWIVLRAMEKDPTRRYETANELALDIQRHLGDEPVCASPPSAMYVLRKFVRRNKRSLVAPVTAGAALFLGCALAFLQADWARQMAFGLLALMFIATVLAFVVSWREALRADRNARLAESQAAEAEHKAEIAHRAQIDAAEQARRADAEAEEAKRQAAIAQAVSDFLNQVLSSLSPDEAGREVLVSDVLDDAARRLDERFGDEPMVEARLSLTIGRAFFGLGRYGQAAPRLEWAKTFYTREFGEEHELSRRAASALALLYTHEGRLEEAATLLTRTLEIQRRVLGDRHQETVSSMTNLGGVRMRQARLRDAEAILVETLETGRDLLGEDHPDTLRALHLLGIVFLEEERYTEAEAINVRTLEVRRRLLGDNHPETLKSANNLAYVYELQDRLSEAERYYARALEGKMRTLGPEHPGTLIVKQNLARVYGKQGRSEQAGPMWRALIETHLRLAEHPDADAESKKAAAYVIVAAHPEVVHDLHPAVELAHQACEMTAYQNWEYLETLAEAMFLVGKTHEAIKHQRRALELLPPGTPSRRKLEATLARFESDRSDDAA